MNVPIEIEQLKFSYQKNENILNIPHLKISEGEKVFIYGPSGSGKSTLLNLMSAVISPTSGTIKILGKNLSSLGNTGRDHLRGNHIGYIFQSFNLIPYLSIYENILLPLKSSKVRASRVTNLDDEIKRIATHLKLQDHLNKRVTQLSVGQQQRVAVARALIGSPEIIIADEPTSSLDEDVTESFMELLLEEQKNRQFTLVFVSHDRRLAKFFDREVSLIEINSRNSHD